MDNNAIETLKNDTAITFSTKPGIYVTTETKNSGMVNQQKVFKLKGRVMRNKPTVIATMRVDAAANNRFKKAPSLQRFLTNRKSKNKSSLKIKLSSVVKDDNSNITGYLYNLIYTGKEKISKSNALKYKLETKIETIVNKILGIIKVNFGRDEVLIGGEKRLITVYGDPNSSFKLALTKIIEEKDGNGDVYSVGEHSMLRVPGDINYAENEEVSDLANGTFENHLGEIGVIDKTLNERGQYSFFHTFPTASSETKYGINILPTTISSKFNTKLFEKNRDGWDGWYSKTLIQSPDPTITIRYFMIDTTGAPHKTIRVNGFTTQASNGATFNYDKLYRGQYNKTPQQIKARGTATATGGYLLSKFKQEYTILLDGGGTHEFAITKPSGAILSNISQSDSDWTNSVPVDNGGTDVSIVTISPPAISTTGTSNDTCKFTIDYKVRNWGTKDTVYALDLNQIITVTT